MDGVICAIFFALTAVVAEIVIVISVTHVRLKGSS